MAGEFLNDLETPVQAVTRLGGGYWILTPLRTTEGYIVLVNRGFRAPEPALRGGARERTFRAAIRR